MNDAVLIGQQGTEARAGFGGGGVLKKRFEDFSTNINNDVGHVRSLTVIRFDGSRPILF
jgi:hypothetical protein